MAAWPRVVLLLLAKDARMDVAGFGCRISISLIAHTCAKGPKPKILLLLRYFLPCFLLQSGDIKKIKLTFKQVDSHLTARARKSESEHVLCILLSAMSAVPVCVCVACVCVRACATMINYFCIHLHTNLLPHCLPRALSGLLCQPALPSPSLPLPLPFPFVLPCTLFGVIFYTCHPGVGLEILPAGLISYEIFHFVQPQRKELDLTKVFFFILHC